MSLKNKFFSVVTSAAAVAAFAVFASAQETPAPTKDNVEKQETRVRKEMKRGEHAKGMRDKHRGGFPGLRGIELTDAQKEQLRAIHEANRPNEATRQEMSAIMKAKRDGTITAEQQERLKAVRDEARQKGEKIHQQILGILTTEQRQQIETRKLEMRQKMQERRELQRQHRQQPTETAKPAEKTKPTDN
jgi:Spy/CpxP family protein refolding chaperone